jgi:hypothetical protein
MRRDESESNEIKRGEDIFLLVSRTFLDDKEVLQKYEEDWEVPFVIGAYANRSDAQKELNERMQIYVLNYVKNNVNLNNLPKEKEGNSSAYKLFEEHFSLRIIGRNKETCPDERIENFPVQFPMELTLKDDSFKNHLQSIFFECTKGQFCVQKFDLVIRRTTLE